MRFSTKIWIMIGVAVSVAMGFWLLRPLGVPVVSPQKGEIAAVIYATGTVEPVNWAKVLPLQRARIVEYCRCEGKVVRKGDVLARLDDQVAQAEMRQIKARRDFAQSDLDRLADLYLRGSATRQNLERAETDLRQFENQYMALQAKLGDYLLLSPQDGVILRADGQVGDIAATGDVLFWVGQPNPLHIVAEINEEDVPKIELGQKILLRHDGFPNQTLIASLQSITPKGDPIAKTFRAYFVLPADTPLKIGMSVEANIVIAEKTNATLLPAEAIRIKKTSQEGEIFLLENGKLTQKTVKIGIKGGRFVEILEGLEGEVLVVSPLLASYKKGQAARAKP